jgi:hypothetical protein
MANGNFDLHFRVLSYTLTAPLIGPLQIGIDFDTYLVILLKEVKNKITGNEI